MTEEAPKVEPGALEALMETAGITGKDAEALRAANAPKPTSESGTQPAATGHGAPGEVHEDFGAL